MLRRILFVSTGKSKCLSEITTSRKAILNPNTIYCAPSMSSNPTFLHMRHVRNIVYKINSSSIANEVKQPSYNFSRCFSDGDNSSPSQAEMSLINTLKDKFPSATDIAVVDISGGCGSMYEVYVESPDFKGIRLVKQHQMVSEALKGEIKEMHGIRISTSASK